MRVRTKRGEFPAKRNNFGQRRRAASVGNVTLLRRVHHITAAPQVMKSIVDADDADTELIGKLHAGLHRTIGDGLTKLFLRIQTRAALNFVGISRIFAPGTQPPTVLPNK